MGLKDVVYVGFDKDGDRRVTTHVRNANMYGNSAVLHAYISRCLPANGGDFENEVMDYYTQHPAKTWQGRGLSNKIRGGKTGRGYVYVLVRVS